MQEFHRFIASKRGQSIGNFSQQERLNQQYKQSLHNQDEKYLMNDQSQQQELKKQNEKNNQQQDDDQVDPLDAFMNNLQQENPKIKKNTQNIPQIKINLGHNISKNISHNFATSNVSDNNQHQENVQHEQWMQQQPQWSNNEDDDNQNITLSNNQNQNNYKKQTQSDQQKYNQDQQQQEEQQFYQNGENNQKPQLKNKQQKKIIQTLKPFDFGQVELEDFQKDFYDQHQDIKRLTENQIKTLRKQWEIKVSGTQIPNPIVSFGHLELDEKMKKVIMKEGFQKPTPIQAQALPIALKGRDLIGVAKTGSGKTLAYVWPLITHVGHQRQSNKGQGPVGLILAPTHQLCQQIYMQVKKYSKRYQMNTACILGGQNKHQQWKILKAGVDILIASPGRLIQMIKKKATNMFRVTYLVLDQADKMLSLGFQQQIRSIISQTRPDRQTLLFTATMKKSMQFLAFDILDSPIRINIGEQNSANQDVKQQVVIVQQKQQKFEWLRMHLSQIVRQGKILIFCNQKDTCQEIKLFIQGVMFHSALTLHGDKSQYQRTSIMNSFKGSQSILIATDIAGRGIDVKGIKTVINFQCPKTIQAYIHRIGRAGRAGQTGTAISFLNKSQSSIKFSIELIKIFENSGYPVSKQLQDLACLDDFYRRKRISSKMGVSFAKGKDASKFLNQILKKQQMGNSRAGLGMNPNLAGYNVKQKGSRNILSSSFAHSQEQDQQPNTLSIADILKQKNLSVQNLSISQLSKLIRQQKLIKDRKNLASNKLKSHFVRSSQGKLGGGYYAQNQAQKQDQQKLGKFNYQESRNTGIKKQQVTVTYYKKKG